MQPEITAKIGAMFSTFKQVRHSILHRESVPIETRMALCQGILFTRGLHQAGTWPQLYASEFTRVHTAVMKRYSSVFHSSQDGARAPSHAVVSSHDDFIAPAIMILYMRLCLFSRVCLNGPLTLCVVLSRTVGVRRSWMTAVAEDLDMLSERAGA
eukprot:4304235-Pyramimonas_sp.AAC.1